MEIQLINIDEIIPYENNAKLHPKEQIEQIKKSILEFGNNDPIAIDKDNIIIEGHGRLLALKELGYKEVEVIRLGHLTEEQRKAYTLIHNKLTMNTEFDLDILMSELEDIDFIDMGEFDFDLDIEDIEPEEVEEDEYEIEIPKEPKAKLGDIYALGNHRLMCGDSTSIDDVEKLMNGYKVDLLVTDPPYNVEIVGGNHSESPSERKKKGNLTIANDNMTNDEFHKFLYDVFVNAYTVLKDGASFYVWYASREVVNFQTSIEEAGLTVKQELIWNKNSLVMGRQDYQWKHEPCLYGWKETGSHNWYGDRKQTTIIDWDRPSKNDLHPTMKPVGLFDYQIKNSSKKGDIVLDLFGGSGTTIIACEQSNRNCYMMEYDPKYVDVIIDRWETLTGNKAVLLNECI